MSRTIRMSAIERLFQTPRAAEEFAQLLGDKTHSVRPVIGKGGEVLSVLISPELAARLVAERAVSAAVRKPKLMSRILEIVETDEHQDADATPGAGETVKIAGEKG